MQIRRHFAFVSHIVAIRPLSAIVAHLLLVSSSCEISFLVEVDYFVQATHQSIVDTFGFTEISVNDVDRNRKCRNWFSRMIDHFYDTEMFFLIAFKVPTIIAILSSSIHRIYATTDEAGSDM